MASSSITVEDSIDVKEFIDWHNIYATSHIMDTRRGGAFFISDEQHSEYAETFLLIYFSHSLTIILHHNSK